MCLKIIAVNGRIAAKPGFCLSGSQPKKSAAGDLRVTADPYTCAYQSVWHYIPKDVCFCYKTCVNYYCIFVAGGGGNEIYESTQSCRLRCTRPPIKVSTFETSTLAECDCHAGCLQTATCCPDYTSYCMLGKSHVVVLHCDFLFVKLCIYSLLRSV